MKQKTEKNPIIKKILFIMSIFCIITAGAVLIINGYVKATAKSRIISSGEALSVNADCILVLGAGIYEDNKPTDILEDRILQGIELYELGASDKLLMSGDHGRKNYDEVNAMKNYAKEAGVSSEDIFMDHAGFATYESLYRARDIFKAKKIIIVTQKYHLYRALYIADKLGIKAYGVPSNLREYKGQTIFEMREILARFKDFFNCLIKPKPTYLGEAIPVSGNGDLTND